MYNRRVAYSHLRTFRDVYRLLEPAADATPESARALVRQLRRRVSRLNAAIASAISSDSTLLTLEQLLADPTPLPAPEQPRSDITMREFRAIQNRSVNSAYANHPAGCPGCRDHRSPYDPPLF